MTCLFCKIVQKELPSTILFENDQLMAFKDIHPKAPTHVLIIPKKHIATINDCHQNDQALLGNMILTAKALAEQAGIADEGYRLGFNVNHGGGQEVYHIHLHLLGGQSVTWSPG